ncbi:hypothetical protein T4B_7449, partial [Trichinella pseudospiralis]
LGLWSAIFLLCRVIVLGFVWCLVSVHWCLLLSAHLREIKPVSAVCLSYLLHVRDRTGVVLRLGDHHWFDLPLKKNLQSTALLATDLCRQQCEGFKKCENYNSCY